MESAFVFTNLNKMDVSKNQSALQAICTCTVFLPVDKNLLSLE